MRFIKTEDLRPGMRLAKPIYNKNGVLLYERNSELTRPGITSVKHFGLFGIYVLEPAEPLPPLSREDLEFEQLQTVYMFKLRECIDLILKRKKPEPLNILIEDILKHYGSLDHRVNFNQNLRSGEDFMYKHAISTAILIAMMTSHMGYTHQKQQVMVAAALLYDIGYGYVPKPILEKGMDLEPGDEDLVQHALERGLEYLGIFEGDFEFFPRALALMRAYIYSDIPDKLSFKPDDDLKFMVQVMRVADHFDQMTAMNIGHEPMSEIMAMRQFSKNKKLYHPQTVSVLANCIHIVPRAASVDLSTGDKGIILVENPDDFMRPVVLRLSDNKIFDLSQSRDYREVQIVDIMKTMDNRIAVDEDTLKQFVPDKELSRITSKFRDALDRSATAG